MIPRLNRLVTTLVVLLVGLTGLAIVQVASAPTATAVVRPAVSTISPVGGILSGGTRVTIRGSGFGSATVVKFGTRRARVISRAARRLVVVAPAALPGAARVIVQNRTRVALRKPVYTYRLPSTTTRSSIVAKTGTFVATTIDWVSGGPSVDRDPDATPGTPYVVSLPSGSAVPLRGARFLVRPGNAAYTSGLAGTVSEVGFQQDGTIRVTVTPTALQGVLQSVVARSTGPVTPVLPTGRLARAGVPTSFGKLGAGMFDCRRTDGDSSPISFTGGVELKLTDLNKHTYFDAGDLWNKPKLDVWVSGKATISGTVGASVGGGPSLSGGATCELKAAWANAHRLNIPVVAGFTLSIGPRLSFKLSLAGEIKIEQTTTFLYGVEKTGDAAPVRTNIARTTSPVVTGGASLNLTAQAGIEARVGFMDRIGVAIGAVLQVKGTGEMKGNPLQFCASLTLSIVIDFGLYFDAWVRRWDVTLLAAAIDLKKWEKCTAPAGGSGDDSAPSITSSELPAARIGDAYETTLGTVGDRSGAWSLSSGTLPPGLSLGSGGVIAGTPTSGIGTWRPTVRFVELGTGRSDTALLLLRVLPDEGLGGGIIQATLTWDGPADLDLHGWDPDGAETYYSQPGPSDNGAELDHDANAGCDSVDPAPAENIRWNSSDPVSGEYWFRVVTWSTCETDQLSWHLVVRVNGVVRIDEVGYDSSDYFLLEYPLTTTAKAGVRPRAAARTAKP